MPPRLHGVLTKSSLFYHGTAGSPIRRLDSGTIDLECVDRQIEVKPRASTQLAACSQFAAMQFGDTAGDGQPQPQVVAVVLDAV